MKNYIKSLILILITVSVNVIFDQETKNIARNYLENREPIAFFYDTFVLVYAENKGAFLSIFSNLDGPIRDLILILLPAIGLIGAFYYALIGKLLTIERFLLATVIGGGIGNLIDRAIYGSVVDFMNFGIGPLRTGIVNFADISITFGLILFLLVRFIHERKMEKSKSEQDSSTRIGQ